MKSRELLTTATVVLVFAIGGFALVDSLRGCDTTTPTAATTTERAALPNEPPPPEEIRNWPQGELEGIVTFVDAGNCRIREVGLVTGRERSPSQLITNCFGFWAPKAGTYVAYSEASRFGYLRIADLREPERDLGEYPLDRDTTPVWSPNGLRLAWCDSPTTGIERKMTGQERSLRFCPIAYTSRSELAHVVGNRLVVGARTVATAPAPIVFAQFGTDGSIAVVSDGGMLFRYAAGRPTMSSDISLMNPTAPPVLSPDTCTAAVTTETGVFVVPLSCSATISRLITGTSAAWSPDGAWLAVSGPDRIVFQGIDDFGELRWPAMAAQLQWRSGG